MTQWEKLEEDLVTRFKRVYSDRDILNTETSS